MAGEQGYAQIWGSSNPDPEAVMDYGPEGSDLDHGQRAYEIDVDGFDQAYLLDMEDSGVAFVGYKQDEIVFAGTRASARDAYGEFNHQTGALKDAFNGVEEDRDHIYDEPFEGFHELAGQTSDLAVGLEDVSEELEPEAAEKTKRVMADGLGRPTHSRDPRYDENGEPATDLDETNSTGSEMYQRGIND